MNGGILGKSNLSTHGGVHTPNTYIHRPGFCYAPLWNPTSTSGLTAVNGSIEYASGFGVYGGAITLSKTSASYNDPHFYGGIGGTYNLENKQFEVSIYFSATFLSVCRTSDIAMYVGFGTGTSSHRGVGFMKDSLVEGWNNLRFNAPTSGGSISNLTAVTWLIFTFWTASASTKFATGNIYVDAVLGRG